MIAAFLACLLGQTKLITLDSPGWSVPQILAEVSKQTGQDFEAKDDVRNDHVIVHVDHVPIKDFLDRFAKALFCKWTMRKGAYALMRSRVLVTRAELASQKKLALRIADALAPYKEELAENPLFDESYAESITNQLRLALKNNEANYLSLLFDSEKSLPLARALKKTLLFLGPTVLAALQDGRRAVYSTHPNSLQLALPRSVMTFVAQAVKEQAVWRKESTMLKADPAAQVILQSNSFQGAAGAILALQKQKIDSAISADLTIFDNKGSILGTTSLQIELAQDSFSATQVDSYLNGVGTPVKLSANTLEGLRAALIFGRSIISINLIRTELLHPVEYEPLSLFASGCLKALGAQKSESVIAYGDLSLLLSFANYGPKADFDTTWATRSTTRFYENVEEGQGWLVATPSDFDEYVSTRINRKALEGLFGPYEDAGWVPVDAAAHFISGENLEIPDGYAQIVGSACFGSSSCPLDARNWALEGIYGMLRPDQISAAESGDLTVSMLSPAQKKALRDGLINRSIGNRDSGYSNVISDGSQIDDTHIGLTEQTLAFANELPPEMTIRLTRTIGGRTLLAFDGQQPNASGAPTNEASIAWNVFMAAHKPESATRYLGYQLGTQDQVDIQLTWPYGEATADFQSSKPQGDIVRDWNLLPVNVAADIRKQLAIYEKQFKQNPNMISEQEGIRQGTPP